MTVNAAILDLQSKALALSGMKYAPDSPPEATSAFPFAVSYEASGNLQLRSSGYADDLATIFTEFHVSRQILPKAIETAMAFRDPFLKSIIADPTLGGTVSTIVSINKNFGFLEWAKIETVGYRFSITVKVRLTT